jgi:hypothetical protein
LLFNVNMECLLAEQREDEYSNWEDHNFDLRREGCTDAAMRPQEGVCVKLWAIQTVRDHVSV